MRHIIRTGKIKRGRLLVFPLASALILSLEAQGNCAKNQFDGIYAGASLGYMNQNTNLDAKQDPGDARADTFSATTNQGLPTIEALLGWGKVFLNCFYGGIEGRADLVMGGSKIVAEDSNFIYKSGRKSPGITLLARLGYMVSHTTMIYGGVGVKAVQFMHNLFEKADQISAPFSKRSLNLLTEVGLETALVPFQNVRVRLSYAFMPRRNLTQKTTQFPQNHMYRGHGAFKAATSEHAINIGLIYKF